MLAALLALVRESLGVFPPGEGEDRNDKYETTDKFKQAFTKMSLALLLKAMKGK